MLDGLTGGACRMLNSFAGFCRGFLDCLASLLDWTLIVRSHPQRCAKQQNDQKCEMSHSDDLRFVRTEVPLRLY